MRKKKKVVVPPLKMVPPLILNTSNLGGQNASFISSAFPNSTSVDNANQSQSFQVSLGIDFTFNTIKNVKKVNWKEDAPWYREITDGLSWLCYCHNPKCPAFKQLVVVNKGFGVFSIQKEMLNLRGPCCSSSVNLQVRNSGFVNCEWAMRGILNRNKDSKIYADGRTYDSKLYTFKECDYRHIWFALDIMVKPIDTSNGKA